MGMKTQCLGRFAVLMSKDCRWPANIAQNLKQLCQSLIRLLPEWRHKSSFLLDDLNALVYDSRLWTRCPYVKQTLFAKATAASFRLFSICFLARLDYKIMLYTKFYIWRHFTCEHVSFCNLEMYKMYVQILAKYSWPILTAKVKKFVNRGRKELLRGFTADSPSLSPSPSPGEWLRAPIQRVKELVLTLLSPSKMPLKNGNTDPLATFAIL